MPFIGNQPALSYTSFAKQDFTTSATTSYTLDNPVANANELALFINFVRQEPTTAYSASGTTLTLTSATSSSDDMYCVYLGKAVQTVNPPNASVGTSQLVDGAVTTAKITDANVTSAKLNYPLTTFSSTGIDDNADATAITIDSSERVGIGTASPDCKLRVDDSVNQSILAGVNSSSSFSSNGVFLQLSRNTTNNSFYAIGYYNAGAGNYKFRVADSGNVTNTNNSYGSISDEKLKENIVDATPKLEKLKQVRIVNFNFIDDNQKQIGVIAQELENIFPSMVEESPDKDEDGKDLNTTTKQVKYSVFVPILIKALQEANSKIEELETRIQTLENN